MRALIIFWPRPYTMRETSFCLSACSDCLRFCCRNQAPMPPTATISTMKIASTSINMVLTLASAIRKRLRPVRAVPFFLFEDDDCEVDIMEPESKNEGRRNGRLQQQEQARLVHVLVLV